MYADWLELDYENSVFTRSENFDAYSTDSDGTDAWSICTVELVLNDRNWEEVGDIFGKIYHVTNGVILFDDQGSY